MLFLLAERRKTLSKRLQIALCKTLNHSILTNIAFVDSVSKLITDPQRVDLRPENWTALDQKISVTELPPDFGPPGWVIFRGYGSCGQLPA